MYPPHTATRLPEGRNEPETSKIFSFVLHRLPRRAIEILCTLVVVITLLGLVHAEESPAPSETPSLPAAETLAQPPATGDPVTVDPFIQLQGSVWRTKAGIVFLKTPIGLLTLTSKTTLKDLKASQEVRFWLHERHSVVEIRKKDRWIVGPSLLQRAHDL